MLTLRYLYAVALAVWLGGMVGIGALAAPATFQVLEAQVPQGGRALAGAVFGEVLRRFHPLAYLCGATVVLALIGIALVGPRPRAFWLRLAIATVMLALTLYSGLIVSARIERLQTAVGVPVSSLPADDPRRAQFGRLHGLSTSLMVLTLVGALALVFFDARDHGADALPERDVLPEASFLDDQPAPSPRPHHPA